MSNYPKEIQEWFDKLGRPKYIVAPMVDASELPWRMLSRKYGANLCYSPMIHSRLFIESPKYQKDNIEPCKYSEDRPLFIQFCGNNPEILVKAAAIAKDFCDGVDINLGCPQQIAKRGFYGAFLQNDWELVSSIVKEIREKVNCPVSCKIRVFPEIEKTVKYAKMLEEAGCYLLTVHGRTIDQKGANTGIASWEHIKAVKEAVNIPVFANGNIQYLEDADRCMRETGVDGVMSAEGNLHNPSLFAGRDTPVWDMALEYIQYVKKYPEFCPISFIRGHLFKIFHHLLMLKENSDLQTTLAKGQSLQEFEEMSLKCKERFEPIYLKEKNWETPEECKKLPFPPWLCQPYVRPPPKPQSAQNQPTDTETENIKKRDKSSEEIKSYSKKRRIEKRELYNGAGRTPRTFEICINCPNPRSDKCNFKSCRNCCKNHCFTQFVNCLGHNLSGSRKLANNSEIINNKTNKQEN